MREVDRFSDQVRRDQLEAKAGQIAASLASTSPTYTPAATTPSPSPERHQLTSKAVTPSKPASLAVPAMSPPP
eukprot:12028959-Karenia_brevis.AAC.1